MDGGIDLTRRTFLSEDRLYQYAISMEVDPSRPGTVLFCGPAPYVTDPIRDSLVIRRYIEYARRWGYGRLSVVNLFAYRCVDPALLDLIADPVGPDNNHWLRVMAREASVCVAAWGSMSVFWERARSVFPLLGGVKCLGMMPDGSPRSPMVARAHAKLIPYQSDSDYAYYRA